ncbi:MAG: hypothetical protein ACRD38_05430 [Nitrososphaerales archaeon]
MKRKFLNKEFLGGIAVAALVGLIVSTGVSQNQALSQAPSATTVRDSVTILLDNKVIPEKDFIHLYDSTPHMIMSGHVATKLPCDASGESTLKIVVGQAPDVKPAELELVKELSSLGNMCIYHLDLPPEGIDTVTDVAILNPTDKAIRLPRTATVVIGVNEIAPIGEQMEHNG